jgi:YesN/AraC family two-component response regulator
MGFTRVDMFENGKRALDAMKVEMVDVVFMDIQMPIMSGPEVSFLWITL